MIANSVFNQLYIHTKVENRQLCVVILSILPTYYLPSGFHPKAVTQGNTNCSFQLYHALCKNALVLKSYYVMCHLTLEGWFL